MKRFNCEKAGCAICSKARRVDGFLWIKRYKCQNYEKAHRNIMAKDCLEFRCNNVSDTKECRRCRKGERRI